MFAYRIVTGVAMMMLVGCASLETRLDKLDEQGTKVDTRIADLEKKLAAANAGIDALKRDLTDPNAPFQKSMSAAKEAADKAAEAAGKSEAAAGRAEAAADKAETAAKKAVRAFELGQKK